MVFVGQTLKNQCRMTKTSVQTFVISRVGWSWNNRGVPSEGDTPSQTPSKHQRSESATVAFWGFPCTHLFLSRYFILHLSSEVNSISALLNLSACISAHLFEFYHVPPPPFFFISWSKLSVLPTGRSTAHMINKQALTKGQCGSVKASGGGVLLFIIIILF